jgi:hypothetical protein
MLPQFGWSLPKHGPSSGLTISCQLVVAVVALVIAYLMSDNDCEERRAPR